MVFLDVPCLLTIFRGRIHWYFCCVLFYDIFVIVFSKFFGVPCLTCQDSVC